MSALLGALLPLSEDPFPPTHNAGSSFEGFFIRLQTEGDEGSVSSWVDSTPPSPTPFRGRPYPTMLISEGSLSSSSETTESPNGLHRHHPTPPGDIILVACKLQSAPPDQRICLYLRYITHGSESLQTSIQLRNGKNKASACDRFEVIHFLPSWKVRLTPREKGSSIQPFKIRLDQGFIQVKPSGNLLLDITLPTGKRFQLVTKKMRPWSKGSLPLGSQGPEGLLQHLGLLLPLHWYVHTSGSPATFSIDGIAAGSATAHVEKNWGHSFPSGWLWSQASSPDIQVNLAGGSILGLTAFLIGIRIGNELAWDFTPPFALGPGFAIKDGPNARINYGLGFKIRRDYHAKTVRIEVWDPWRWARIEIDGDPETFATKIPGPMPGEWTPGYCHHSYRCRMRVTLFRRSVTRLPLTLLGSVTRPGKSWRNLKTLMRWDAKSAPSRKAIDSAWCLTLGWRKLGTYQLKDRVALEFGGDFASTSSV